MHIKLINGALVIEGLNGEQATQDLTPATFADKPQTIVTEPAFYVALGADGLLARSVTVTAEDRKTVAALVGNWIAEGFQPQACDIKAYAKHIRALAASEKQKADAIAAAAAEAAAQAALAAAQAGAPVPDAQVADGAANPAAPAAAAAGSGIPESDEI